jgi:hypothetical protein
MTELQSFRDVVTRMNVSVPQDMLAQYQCSPNMFHRVRFFRVIEHEVDITNVDDVIQGLIENLEHSEKGSISPIFALLTIKP